MFASAICPDTERMAQPSSRVLRPRNSTGSTMARRNLDVTRSSGVEMTVSRPDFPARVAGPSGGAVFRGLLAAGSYRRAARECRAPDGCAEDPRKLSVVLSPPGVLLENHIRA
jgi:hypothetical protein